MGNDSEEKGRRSPYCQLSGGRARGYKAELKMTNASFNVAWHIHICRSEAEKHLHQTLLIFTVCDIF